MAGLYASSVYRQIGSRILKEMKESCGFEEIEHTADVALRVWADSFDQLLACAARGMLSLAGVAPQSTDGGWRSIDLHAADAETLLVAWLEEVLFALEAEHVAFSAVDVQIVEDLHLTGRVLTAPANRPTKPIKAITFHDLSIEQTESGMETTLVFDV